MVILYTYIRKNSQNGIFKDKLEVLCRRVTYETGLNFNTEKITNCLNIFAELKLMSYVENGDNTEIYIIDTCGRKVDIENSTILADLRKSNI